MTSDSYDQAGTIVELAEDQCRELLTTTTVGRIAFVDGDGAGQQLVPVNFAYLDGTIYFRTLPDGFLAGLAGGHDDVAFGVDHHEAMYRNGWNVTVKGRAAAVADEATIDMVLAHERLRPWAGGVRPLVIAVSVESIAGRKVVGH
jgi:nitroimidazol reductase NimA-like FMN-containing flavoprotein (pyridoxamine 5'-phosphate oxidase superfamily)